MAWSLSKSPAAAQAAPAAAPAAAPVPPPAPLPPQPVAYAQPAAVPPPAPAPIQQPVAPPFAASSLPPVQQPVAPAPSAAVAAAAEAQPARRTRRPRAEVAPAAAPAPVTAVPAAPTTQAVVAAPAPGVLSTLPANSYLAKFISAGQTPGAAAMGRLMHAFGGDGGEPNLIPTMNLVEAGNAAMFSADRMNPDGSNEDLPVGNAPFYAVFLGYRLHVVNWPRMSAQGNKDRPIWSAIIGSDNAEAYDLAGRAISAYQYTKRELRSIYEGIGHPRAALELLWWEPQAHFLVTRTQSFVNSMSLTMQSLAAALPQRADMSGQQVPVLSPFPAMVAPGSLIPAQTKSGQDITEYPIAIQQQVTGAGGEAMAAFQQWMNSGAYNAEVDAALTEWNRTTLDAAQLQTLQAVIDARSRR